MMYRYCLNNYLIGFTSIFILNFMMIICTNTISHEDEWKTYWNVQINARNMITLQITFIRLIYLSLFKNKRGKNQFILYSSSYICEHEYRYYVRDISDRYHFDIPLKTWNLINIDEPNVVSSIQKIQRRIPRNVDVSTDSPPDIWIYQYIYLTSLLNTILFINIPFTIQSTNHLG